MSTESNILAGELRQAGFEMAAQITEVEGTASSIIVVSRFVIPRILQTTGYARNRRREEGFDPDDPLSQRLIELQQRRPDILLDKRTPVTLLLGMQVLNQLYYNPRWADRFAQVVTQGSPVTAQLINEEHKLEAHYGGYNGLTVYYDQRQRPTAAHIESGGYPALDTWLQGDRGINLADERAQMLAAEAVSAEETQKLLFKR